MTINSVLNSGLEGVQRGIQGAENAALEISRASRVDSSSSTGDANNGSQNSGGVVESIVDLKLYERSVEASAQVVETADEVLGTLIDTLA